MGSGTVKRSWRILVVTALRYVRCIALRCVALRCVAFADAVGYGSEYAFAVDIDFDWFLFIGLGYGVVALNEVMMDMWYVGM